MRIKSILRKSTFPFERGTHFKSLVTQMLPFYTKQQVTPLSTQTQPTLHPLTHPLKRCVLIMRKCNRGQAMELKSKPNNVPIISDNTYNSSIRQTHATPPDPLPHQHPTPPNLQNCELQ